MRIFRVLGKEVLWADEFGGNAGEMDGEVGWEDGGWGSGEVLEGRGRSEEGTGESAGGGRRRDGDEHLVRAWPDVEVVRGDGEVVCARRRGDLELAPESVDVGLGVVEASVLHEVIAGGGVGAVSTDHEVKGDLDFRGTFWVGGGGLSGVLGVVG